MGNKNTYQKNNGGGKPQGNFNKKGKGKNKHKDDAEKIAFIQMMTNYSFPITLTKETEGKSILGAYVNVASDNFEKTIQFICGKIGLKVKSTNYIAILEKILGAYKKKKKWDSEHPGDNKPGKKSQYLLSPEQNDKLRTLLFHHFSSLAPILGSRKNEEISKIYRKKQKEDVKSLSENEASDIIKKVKEAVKSANVNDCIEVLVCLLKALHHCRNLHSHYRAYNNKDNQIIIFNIFDKAAEYLTNVFKASALICQSNAGENAKQYNFITGDYHYNDKKEEYLNYYYCIKGKRSVIKANGKKESDEEYNAISDFGLVYLTSLFLSKSDTELMLEKMGIFASSPFKDKYKMEKTVLSSVMAVYRINIPKGRRLKMEDDDVQICMDMLNELQKCPNDLYEVITQKGKDSFKRERMEPMRDSVTGEYVREKFVKSEKGNQEQKRVISDDGTGNIVYQGTGTYSLLVRKEDRFPYFAMRYIDNRNIFPTIRFQMDLGYYRFAFYSKRRIDESEEIRILQKRINGYGKLVETENARKDKWMNLFQESELKTPNETENAEIAKDDEGNVIELEQLIKSGEDTLPFVTDKRASYNIHNNRIGLYWETSDVNSSKLEDMSAPYVPELRTKSKNGKVRPDVDVITPLASLSVYDLPALIFYEYLRDGNGKNSAERIIKEKYKQYTEFFSGIADGSIKTWDDVKHLEKKDVPEKFWPYLDGRAAGEQSSQILANYQGKDVVDGDNHYHFKGHIRERIDYLEKEIKKFNDICLKMATTDNEYGTDDYKAFRPASLARKMAHSVMEWLPSGSRAKGIMTGVNYGVMSSVLAQFGSDGKDIRSLRAMFVKGGIISLKEINDAQSDYHPFLDRVLCMPIRNMESLYIEYISQELQYIKRLSAELEKSNDKRQFIQSKLPFAKLSRKRYEDRDETYYRSLAQRYLRIENSKNNDGKETPAIILLPDGLFTSSLFKLLQNMYPKIFTGNANEGANNNASYLISTYFEKVNKDESQAFYQCFAWGQRKPNHSFHRHYKFFDFYDDPKLQTAAVNGNRKGGGKKAPAFESSYSQQEINNKLKAIDRKAILAKVEEYIRLEETKIKTYNEDIKYNQSRLKETQSRPEKTWVIHSSKKNQDFTIIKSEEVDRLKKKLLKLEQMINNSKQKIERIKETYAEKLISLKNECQRTERIIRRYRIEDIVTFYMVNTYFEEIFKDKPEEAVFRLQDVGSKEFVESSEKGEAFLDKQVAFSRIIPVTFARDENKMLVRYWENDEKIEKITVDCEVFLNRVAIRNYNLALNDLNDERLMSFLTHFAYIHYQYKEKLDAPLRINYNRLSQEFKMYNQLRPEIFREVHALEKIIVDHNTDVLNNDRHRDFFIPMGKEKLEKKKEGVWITRSDDEAIRNSFVNLLALAFDKHNKISAYTNSIRKSAAHNYYGLLFKELAEEDLLVKILRAYQMPDKMPHELRHFDKERDLDDKDPHSFAALILRRIQEIKDVAMQELAQLGSKS